jgi:ADP-heptose:LPS heptosyltransferase
MSVGSRESINVESFAHTVVFFANALGDHLLVLPTLRALSSMLRGRFTLVTADTPSDLLLGDVACERLVKVPLTWGSGEFDGVAAAAAAGPADLFISVNTWHNDSVSAFLDALSPALSVGFHQRFDRCFYRKAPAHHIDYVFEICDLFGTHGPPEAYAHPFPLPEASVEFVEHLRAAVDGRKVLVVHSYTKPEKTWPMFKVNEAVERFLDEHPDYVALALGKRLDLIEGLSPRIIPITDLPIASAAAVVACADIFLGVDSFPLHVADLWRVPGVALFGATTESREWGFRFSRHTRQIDAPGGMQDIEPARVASLLAEIVAPGSAGEMRYPVGSAMAPVVTLRYR